MYGIFMLKDTKQQYTMATNRELIGCEVTRYKKKKYCYCKYKTFVFCYYYTIDTRNVVKTLLRRLIFLCLIFPHMFFFVYIDLFV